MRIRALHLIHTPLGKIHPGSITILPDHEARDLINKGAAEPVEQQVRFRVREIDNAGTREETHGDQE